LPSANPSLAQEDLRTDTVAGGTGGGAPGAPQPLGEHDGEVSASDRTRIPESELVGGSKKAETLSKERVTDLQYRGKAKPARKWGRFYVRAALYRPLVEVEPVVPVPVEVELVPVLVVVPVELEPVAFCAALPVFELWFELPVFVVHC